jgi:hypothetical protein
MVINAVKPKLLLCLALVLSGGFVVRADESATNAEPRYLDKSLSEWIPLAEWVGGDIPRPRDERAGAAVHDFGTNALPWLLQWIRSDKPETVRLGIEGFNLLGSVAKPAEPELLKMAFDWQTSTAWNSAIPILASLSNTNYSSSAFSQLLPVTTNHSAPAAVRARILESIPHAACNYSAGQLILQCFQDKNWRVVQAAATGLGCCVERKLAVAAVTACLQARTNEPEDAAMRERAVDALVGSTELIYYRSSRPQAELDDLRQTMSMAVPALVVALNDLDSRVARVAATALGEAAVEPDVAVPALLKSLDYPYPDRNGYVRLAAIEALGNFGAAAQSAVPALTKLAQSDPGGYAGGTFAASALKKLFRRPNHETQTHPLLRARFELQLAWLFYCCQPFRCGCCARTKRHRRSFYFARWHDNRRCGSRFAALRWYASIYSQFCCAPSLLLFFHPGYEWSHATI